MVIPTSGPCTTVRSRTGFLRGLGFRYNKDYSIWSSILGQDRLMNHEKRGLGVLGVSVGFKGFRGFRGFRGLGVLGVLGGLGV